MEASETQEKGDWSPDSNKIEIIRKSNIWAPSHAVHVAVCMEYRIKKGRQWLKLLHNPQAGNVPSYLIALWETSGIL